MISMLVCPLAFPSTNLVKPIAPRVTGSAPRRTSAFLRLTSAKATRISSAHLTGMLARQMRGETGPALTQLKSGVLAPCPASALTLGKHVTGSMTALTGLMRAGVQMDTPTTAKMTLNT